tara:strand:- start:1508 stop:1675 length:168 start_codon:yes stop_codon:yes gene_type:complete
MVERVGFEPTNLEGTDLQSVGFNHFPTSPLVEATGLEPATPSVQGKCSPIELRPL